METKVEVRNVRGHEAQQHLEDRIRRLQTAGRRAVRAYAGLWGLAYDEARRLVEQGQQILDQAEARGEQMEEQAGQEAKRWRDQAVRKVRRQAGDTEEAAGSQVGSLVAEVLERLDIPSRAQIERLQEEVESLGQKIEQQFQKDSRPPHHEAR
jgi:polyhydroxyalkanoate synthesis regulator phasin